MKMQLLEVATQPSIYRGCFNRKMFWEEKCTLGEFTPVNMKILVLEMLGNTETLRMLRITPP